MGQHSYENKASVPLRLRFQVQRVCPEVADSGSNWLLIFNMSTVGKLLAILRHIWNAILLPFLPHTHYYTLNISCMPNVARKEEICQCYEASCGAVWCAELSQLKLCTTLWHEGAFEKLQMASENLSCGSLGVTYDALRQSCAKFPQNETSYESWESRL